MKLHAISLILALLAQTGPPATELRFDWPRDLVARVETERTRERRSPQKSLTTMRGSYRMQVANHPEGLSVSYDDFKLDGMPGTEQAEVVGALTLMSPELIVASDGSFSRIGDIARFRAAVQKVFAPLLNQSHTPPQLKAFLDRFVTDDVLTAFAAQEWELLVGAWQDMPLTAEPLTADIEAPSPMWPDVKIPMKLTGRLIERTACARGGVSRDCAVLELRTEVDQPAMESLLKRLMSELAPRGLDAQYERLDVVSVSRIRLETLTMVPHELTTTKTVEMTVSVPGEGRTTAQQIDRRRTHFTY